MTSSPSLRKNRKYQTNYSSFDQHRHYIINIKMRNYKCLKYYKSLKIAHSA